MNILVLGGTKLLGRVLVKNLISLGNNVTIISRSAENIPTGVIPIIKDRSEALITLKGKHFDVIFDFIGFDDKSVCEVFENITTDRYIFISSAWMPKLNPLTSLDQQLISINQSALDDLPEITLNYLTGKRKAENYLAELNKVHENISILRLPIFLDRDEYTQRLKFYINRVLDGNPIIMVNGGLNIVQVAWVEDLARVICEWIDISKEEFIWEALSGEGISVYDFINLVAKSLDKDLSFINIDSCELEKSLPEYLESEPFWCEQKMQLTKNNIFLRTKITPTPIEKWIPEIVDVNNVNISELRKKEIELIKKVKLC